MINDNILEEKSEERLCGILEKKGINDFWSAFRYLTTKIHVTELQAFSICIRKFEFNGMFSKQSYSFIEYYTQSHVENYFISGMVRTLTIQFIKNISTPIHLKPLYSFIQSSNHPVLMRHINRLQYEQLPENPINIKDDFIIDTLFSIQQLDSTTASHTGQFRLT